MTLALMTTASVASLHAAPTMAVYGPACVFLPTVPAIVFLLPTSLVSAERASGWSGGVHRWVSEGLSKPLGFLAVWCRFAMTIFHHPNLPAFVASTLAYVIAPLAGLERRLTSWCVIGVEVEAWLPDRGRGQATMPPPPSRTSS